MVRQYQSPVRVYKYPFELVMAAYERRFPKCPQIPVVIDCVVTEETTSPDESFNRIVRRCQLNVEAPYILKKLIGVDYVFFIQINELNRRDRCLHIEAYNESFSSRVEILEKCRYYVHPENSEWTCFEQSASLDIKNFYGFEHTMEKLGMKQYSQNIAKGKEIIEHFIDQLKTEGIDSVPRWTEPFPEVADVENDEATKDSSEVKASPAPAGTLAAQSPLSPTKIKRTDSDNSIHCQLETDYIQRYLGELTVLQESGLVQLRKWVAEFLKGKVPNDQTLLRFLRARDFHVEKAREMLSQSLLWRKKHHVDRILSEYETPTVIKEYFPGGWHHSDKDGRPLFVLRLGQMDVKGILKTIGEDGLLKLTLHVCEEGLKKMEEATKVTGKPISTWCLLVDLEGLNMRHLWRPGIRAFLRIIAIVEANYPETMGRVLVIRTPRVFPILWTLVGTFIDENTRSKFIFYGGNDYLLTSRGLADYIPENVLPEFLGGPCQTSILEGGLVPKSLYMSDAWLEKEGCALSEDSMYQSTSIGNGQLHEIVIHNEESGSVLTWDFDVMRHDVSFTVFFTAGPLMAKDGNSGALHTIHHMIDHEQKSIIENLNHEKAEPTIICHDGESVQGSHVMYQCGYYVLQWKFYTDHHLDLIDSFTAHKAQIMYFYEMLKAADYKGSMTSLQSGTSGLSASSCASR